MDILRRGTKQLVACFLIGCSMLFTTGGVMADDANPVSQIPLFLGPAEVPGNLGIVMSVEYPTVDSIANLEDYTSSIEFIGYFDPYKCYRYIYDASDESKRHFEPVSAGHTNHRCSGDLWSGNFLNWAGMSTIDPFRWALTGGYRVKDTANETWLQGARITGQEKRPEVEFQRELTSYVEVAGATPFNASSITIGMAKDNSHNLSFTLPPDATMMSGGNIQGNNQYLHATFNGGNTGASTLNSGQTSVNCHDEWRWDPITHNRDRGTVCDDAEDLIVSSPDASSGHLEKLHSDSNHEDYLELTEAASLNNSNLTFSGRFVLKSDDANVALYLTDNNDINSRSGYGFNILRNKIALMSVKGEDEKDIPGQKKNYSAPIKTDTNYSFSLVFNSNGQIKLTVTNHDDNESDVESFEANMSSPPESIKYILIEGHETYYMDEFVLNGVNGASIASSYEQVGSNEYEASRTVAVCVPGLLEGNCVAYGNHYKPEGLLQEYSDQIRYSVFGYLNDSDTNRDGGVLRARQSFIGQRLRDPDKGWSDNPNPEWDNDGILKPNPDPADVHATNNYYGTNINHREFR